MLSAFGGAVIMVSAMTGVLLLFGAVVVRVFRAWLEDQTLSCAEAVAVLAAICVVIALTITLWGSAAMLLPPLVGAAAWYFWNAGLARRDRLAEAEHLANQEAKARAMLERDPTALVAYEQLAEALLQQHRRGEALDVLSAWHEREPNNKHLSRRIAELRAELAATEVTLPPEPVPLDPMLERRVSQPTPAAPVQAPAETTDFGPPEQPAVEPAAPADFGPPAAVAQPESATDEVTLPTETVTSHTEIGGDRPESFAPGSRAFDLTELAYDPDEEEPPDDGFATDPKDLTDVT